MSNSINQSNNFVNSSPANIAFFGTPQFAVPILGKLARNGFKPVAVFCAPDKPVGRKQTLTPPPVKILAQKYNIPVFQPADKKELEKQIAGLKPDLIISAAYGIIISEKTLAAPKFGCLNIHPSLLPKYRGPAPIQNTILNGDQKTGVTIFKMDKGIDTGPLIASRQLTIADKKYITLELSQILAELGAQLLLDILPDWLNGKIQPQAQNDAEASSTKIIGKDDGLIDWRKSAAEIERQIRAYFPWPGAYAKINGKKIKIIEAELSNEKQEKEPGKIFSDGKKLFIQTAKGALAVVMLQLENGKPMVADDFLHGHRDIIGKILN